MRRLMFFIVIVLLMSASFTAQATCVRQNAVGFFTTPEIVTELNHVYADCYPQPACYIGGQNITFQVDGYSGYADWLWTGPGSTTFSETAQNSIIDDAIYRAGVIPGMVIVSITFHRDVIFGRATPVYVLYFRVTFAQCPLSRKGMTWTHSGSNAQTGTITVGCNGCDPYLGDTVCTQSLPLLCIYKPVPSFSVPAGVNNSNTYYKWAGGVVATTPPVAGNAFANLAAANNFCVAQFGTNWHVAEFHDGWGWNFQAYGGTVNAPTVPSSRFWVHINDQPANCWDP